MTGHKKYSAELKQKAVQEYLDGAESQDDICKKYGIRSKSKQQKWIMKYNRHEELKTSGTGGTTFMMKGRKTTFDERVEIVKYCIEHGLDYALTAEEHQVSYQQIYQWVLKYKTKGVEGLAGVGKESLKVKCLNWTSCVQKTKRNHLSRHSGNS